MAESTDSLSSRVERVMREEASKERVTGEIGDFFVHPLSEGMPAELRIFGCADGGEMVRIDRVGSTLRAEELWSPEFDVTEGVGWACAGQGVVLVNNQGLHGQTSGGDVIAKIRGYIDSVPVHLLRDAPSERLELIKVEGHPALIEHPIKDYPYGQANLAVIERYPDGDVPGILVLVERARTSEEAIKIAEEIIP